MTESSSDSGEAAQGRWSGGTIAFGGAATLITVVAALVRLWASGGDLWLDEIWSLHFASSVASPVEILTGLHHDNNHILSTLFLWVFGEQEHWIVYRLPAVAAGIVTVACSGAVARRWGRLETITAMFLTGSSYLLIHYSSEARGYGLAMAFALLAFRAMQRYLEGHRSSAVTFWFVVALGFLSHLSFVHVYIGLLVWSPVALIGQGRRRSKLAADLAVCHAVPLVFVAALYLTHVRHIVIGGGPVFSSLAVFTRTAALTLGAAETGAVAGAAAALLLLSIVVALVLLGRDRPGWTVFFAIAIILSPALLFFAWPPQLLYVRYFLLPVLFSLLLFSYLLARLFRHGPIGKILYGAVLLAVFAGNCSYTADLLKYRRGDYLEALRYIVENTTGSEVTIGSDHDFRNKAIVDYYSPRIGGTKRIVYVADDAWPPDGPDWVILHSLAQVIEPPAALTDAFDHTYSLTRTYPYARLSGWHWFIYRRQQ